MADVRALERPATGFFEELALILAAQTLPDITLVVLFEGDAMRFACVEEAPVTEVADTLKSLRPCSRFTVKTLTLSAQEMRARAQEICHPRVSDTGQQPGPSGTA